jgi:hypothetical protein
MRMRAHVPVPQLEHVVDLVSEHVAGHREEAIVLLAPQQRRLEQVDVGFAHRRCVDFDGVERISRDAERLHLSPPHVVGAYDRS